MAFPWGARETKELGSKVGGEITSIKLVENCTILEMNGIRIALIGTKPMIIGLTRVGTDLIVAKQATQLLGVGTATVFSLERKIAHLT